MDTDTSLNKKKDIDILLYYKMTFIYNALLKGWKVKMLDDSTFEFTNNNKEIKEKYKLHDFLENFLNSNIC